jgi:biopolymer transport protein ExbB/TolQ
VSAATQTPEAVDLVSAQEFEGARSEAERYKAALEEMKAHLDVLYKRAVREQSHTLARGMELLTSIADEVLEAR